MIPEINSIIYWALIIIMLSIAISFVWDFIKGIISYAMGKPNIKFITEDYKGDITVYHPHNGRGSNLSNPIQITAVNMNSTPLLINEWGLMEVKRTENNITGWIKKNFEDAIDKNLTNTNPFYFYIDKKDLVVLTEYFTYIKSITGKYYKSKIKLNIMERDE